MPRKKPEKEEIKPAIVEDLDILETIETNYAPYMMSVIVSRAIPEIDGLKPSHRKLLYTMYKMGLLNGARTKSANVVGQTMKLNPHGDQAIYETLVRLSRGNDALLHPPVDSKGNFGKFFSRDMAFAASRYTEVKLDAISAEFFRDIDEDTVDFADNYDNTMKEPKLLPATFPSVLVMANTGIAVGMASSIASFNLAEVCETAIALIKNPKHDILSTLPAPDFTTGAEILYDRNTIEQIYETGRGGIRIRSKWRIDSKENRIEIYEIPYSTTIEAIMDKITELVKSNKIKEISDMRDEIDLSGLKLTLDLKRGVDPDKLMAKLCKMTPIEDTFSCNFNILIEGTPHVMGVRTIFEEWTAWRTECVRRRTYFRLSKLKEKLHLLQGLQKILLDIDRAIKIIRETDEESEVVPNLMIGFGIDEIQANYVAEIKLRNINREYIMKRTAETKDLEKEIDDVSDTLKNQAKLRDIIAKELKDVIKKYAKPRRTTILYEYDSTNSVTNDEDEIEDYPVNLFVTRAGYFKKITPQSLRMSGEQKLKEGDTIFESYDATNAQDLIIFTDKYQAYKKPLSEFDDSKASVLGDFLPSKVGMDDGESAVAAFPVGEYTGDFLFIFENGKVARVPVSSYETKTNRKKLAKAYSDKSKLVAILKIEKDIEFVLYSSDNRAIIAPSASLSPKTTRDTQGVQVMNVKVKAKVASAYEFTDDMLPNPQKYRARGIPGSGSIIKGEQLTMKSINEGE